VWCLTETGVWFGGWMASSTAGDKMYLLANQTAFARGSKAARWVTLTRVGCNINRVFPYGKISQENWGAWEEHEIRSIQTSCRNNVAELRFNCWSHCSVL
jgi:hypothetical protein